MQTETTSPRAEPAVEATQTESTSYPAEPAAEAMSSGPSRRTVFGLMAVVLLAGFAAGFFGRPVLMSIASLPGQAQASFTVDQQLSVTESYQRLAQEVAALADRADQQDGEALTQSVRDMAEEVRRLRTLNPYFRFKEIQAATIPSGVPALYGDALDVSFEQVKDSMNKLSPLDPTFGAQKIVLSGADLERYTHVGLQTACRYCCDARTLVFPDGKAACRCQHSQAMRGLAAYLITTQGDRYTDEELVTELNRWRAVFFPKQTLVTTLAAMKQAGEQGVDQIEVEFPEFMPRMVGDC